MTGNDRPLELAVVGAGTAGLYCAWRAATHGSGDVALFEGSGRLGGRIQTVVPDGAPTLRGELGGIALMSGHELLMGLVEHLGLEREPLRGGDPHDLLYLRGHRLTAADWGNADAVPYDLAPEERGLTPEQLLAVAIEKVVPDARRLDPRGWDEVKRRLELGDRSLSDIGLWNLLRDLVSEEAFRLMADAGSFRPQFENWNAAEALPDLCADWPEGSRYERLRDGYEALPVALAEGIRAGGGAIEVGHRLRSIDRAGSGEALALGFDVQGHGSTTIEARRVVLALPQAGLAELAPRTPLAGDAGFAGDLERVRDPCFHLLLAYERPWWEELGIETGPFGDRPAAANVLLLRQRVVRQVARDGGLQLRPCDQLLGCLPGARGSADRRARAAGPASRDARGGDTPDVHAPRHRGARSVLGAAHGLARPAVRRRVAPVGGRRALMGGDPADATSASGPRPAYLR